MAQQVSLQATKRTEKVNRVRANGAVPAVLYGSGLKNETLQVNSRDFIKAFSQSGSTTLVDLDIEGKMHNVLIREVQYHPVLDHPIHIDFYQVRMDEVVRAEVPLKFVGEAPAVKDLGGIFVRNIDAVEVEALPRDLPHDIEVDISSLTAIDQAIHISDLQIPTGVTVLEREAEDVIALIQAPRSEAELEQLETEIKEDVESVEKAGPVKEEEAAEGAEGEAGASSEAAK